MTGKFSLISTALLGCALTANSTIAEEWQFQLTPYLWATALDGKTGTNTPPSSADVDVSFSDIMDNLDMALLLNFQARKGQWGLAIDTVYMNTSTDENVGHNSKIDLDMKQTVASFGGFFAPSGVEGLELHAGLRHVDLDNTIKFKGNACELLSLAGRSCKVGPGDDWVEGYIGARYSYALSPKWNLIGYGDIGGFSGQSDGMHQVMLATSYQFSDSFTLTGGYRIFDVDYDDNNFVYDVKTDGLLVGAAFTF